VVNVSAEHASLYAAHEEELTPALASLSVRDTTAAMRSWRLHAEATSDGTEAASHPSEIHFSETMESRHELLGHLSVEDAAMVEAAIAAALPAFDAAEAPLPSAAERRAAALVDVCRWFLDNSPSVSSGSRTRPHVPVVVELKELLSGGPGQLVNGTPVPARTIEWLSCDSELHRILTSGRSRVLDYGSAVRTISQALWAALVVRDRHCRHPGCDRPPT
jgi:5-methylcytosine-specific restriction protein A